MRGVYAVLIFLFAAVSITSETKAAEGMFYALTLSLLWVIAYAPDDWRSRKLALEQLAALRAVERELALYRAMQTIMTRRGNP